jgi:hypothetical protein
MTMDELLGEMPKALLVQALDDDGDGIADAGAWEAVQAAAEERIRAAFGGDPPAKHATAVSHARKLFILVVLYDRRGFTGETNPYTAAANRAEKRLEDIASGDASLDAGGTEPAFVGRPAKVANTAGLMG